MRISNIEFRISNHEVVSFDQFVKTVIAAQAKIQAMHNQLKNWIPVWVLMDFLRVRQVFPYFEIHHSIFDVRYSQFRGVPQNMNVLVDDRPI